MQLVDAQVSPLTEAIVPTLRVELSFRYTHGFQVPLDVDLTLRIGKKIHLGVAHRVSGFESSQPFELRASSSHTSNHPRDFKLAFELKLTDAELSVIETTRLEAARGDLVLALHYAALVVTTEASEVPMVTGPTMRTEEGETFTPAVMELGDRSSRSNRQPLIRAGNQLGFLKLETLRGERSVTIPASHWAHDYRALWERTKFITVDLPIVAATTDGGPWAERLNAAIEAVTTAGDHIAGGRWNDVCLALRPVFELTRDHATLTSLLDADGYTVDAAAELRKALEAMFTFASKFGHRTARDKTTVVPLLQAEPEEASLVYATAVTVVNLLAAKVRRGATGQGVRS